MDIVIAGGHGKVAMLLHPMLVERGHRVRGLIRKQEQAGELEDVGAKPVIFDLEHDDDIASAIDGADAVVFAAGAGPGSGAERKLIVDRDGAIKLMEGAKTCGISRYVMLSAMGVDGSKKSDNTVYETYRQAKRQADKRLRKSGLNYSIIRPGVLTNDEGTGLVTIGRSLSQGEIPRADVAAVLAYCLEHTTTIGLQVELISGDKSIEDAFAAYFGSGTGEQARP